MRLIVELSEDAVPDASSAAASVELHELAAALRTPRVLRRLLRGQQFECVEIRSGELPASALQAGVQFVLVIARTGRWRLGGRDLGRAAFASHAAGALLGALARELWFSALATIRLTRAGRRQFGLPRSAATTASALYLRVEPSLRWQGVQVGGAATHTSGVINGLIANGVSVRVIAAEEPSGIHGAGFTRAPARRRLQLVRGLGYADYGQEIIRAAAAHRADFVYQRYQLGSHAGLEIARRLAVPLVLEFNGPEVWVERHWRAGRRLLLEGPLEQLEQHHLEQASLVVTVSDALRDQVLAAGVPPERVLMNPNGVDIDALAPFREDTPSEWRLRAGLPDRPTVGFIGTFGPWHGAQLLPELIAQVPDAQWVLIGGGGLVEEVRREIEERDLSARVTMPGLVEHRRALELLAACDVCVSPHIPPTDGSQFFGSPTKLFEYMGLAKPIVASDLEQIGQVIEHERTGVLCPPGDVGLAAGAVRRLLEDEQLRARLGAAALERAATDYSWEAHARRILEALGGSGARR
jgi:glycosyltransferase involved in cell wall biosynthesis